MFPPGVLPLDKPPGPTSFAMVRQVRRLAGVKKVGHAGSLDPFASGLLILCVGRPATRLIETIMAGAKTYEAVLQLGVETSTQDPEGEVVARREVPRLEEADIEACLEAFRGEILQTPPLYSALKYQGRPLYDYARRGEAVPLEEKRRRVVVHELTALGYDPVKARLSLRVRCGRGTYIRSLAADIGAALGCGACLRALRRTASGCFGLDRAVAGDILEGEAGREALLQALIPVEEARAMLGMAAAG